MGGNQRVSKQTRLCLDMQRSLGSNIFLRTRAISSTEKNCRTTLIPYYEQHISKISHI